MSHAAEPTGELREQVAERLASLRETEFYAEGFVPERIADALLSGPLAPLLAKLRAVEAVADELMTERDLVPGIARRAAAERVRRALDAES